MGDMHTSGLMAGDTVLTGEQFEMAGRGGEEPGTTITNKFGDIGMGEAREGTLLASVVPKGERRRS